jgi:hypothetical protein
MLDQARLKETGEDKRLLTEALQKLDLHTLRFLDGLDYVDGSTDIPGLRKVYRKTNKMPIFAADASIKDGLYAAWQSHVWEVLLAAVAKSGHQTLAKFHALTTGKGANGMSVSHDLNAMAISSSRLKIPLANVKNFALTLNSKKFTIPQDGVAWAKGSERSMRRVGQLLPSLQELDLMFDMERFTGHLLRGFLHHVNLGNLTNVSLHSLSVNGTFLCDILLKSSSLKTLKLDFANLTKGNWPPILKVLMTLKTLTHLHLMWCQENNTKVYFLEQKEEEEDPNLAFDQAMGGADDWVDDDGLQDEGGEDEDIDDDDDDTDEDIPSLEPGEVFGDGHQETSVMSQPATLADALRLESEANLQESPLGKQETELDFKAPGNEDMPERGYYVCLDSAEAIAKYLPIFIKEYNLGDHLADDPFGAINFPVFMQPPAGQNGGAGPGPAALNALMNFLAGPPPPQGGGAAAGNAQGGGAAEQGNGGQNNGGQGSAAGGQGLGGAAPPPSIVVGSGPGYSIMMGAVPMNLPAHGGAQAQPSAANNTGTHAAAGAAPTTSMNTSHNNSSGSGGTGSTEASTSQPQAAALALPSTSSGAGGAAFPNPWMHEEDDDLYFDEDDEMD